MANLILPKIRTTQPQSPVRINWENPITLGLSSAISPFSVGISSGYQKTALISGTIGFGNTVNGRSFNGSMLLKGNPFSMSSKGTVFVLLKTNAAAGLKVACSCNTFWLGTSNNGTTLNISDSVTDLSYSVNANQFYAVAAVADAPSFKMFCNGLLVNSRSGGLPSGVGNFSVMNYENNATLGFSGDVLLAIAFTRVLTDGEIKSLSNNPWQIFAPERRFVAFDFVAGGGVNSVFSTYQAQRVNAGFNRTISATAQTKSVQAENSVLNRMLSSSINEFQVQSDSSILQRSVSMLGNSKQVESINAGLARNLNVTAQTKQIEKALSGFSGTLNAVFSSQTKQAQKNTSNFSLSISSTAEIKQIQIDLGGFNRAISSQMQTKQTQKSNVITNRTLNALIGIKSVQKMNSVMSLSVNGVASISQAQIQKTVSSYALSINFVTSLRQVQKTNTRFQFLVSGFVPSVIRSYVVTHESRNYVVNAENRNYVI